MTQQNSKTQLNTINEKQGKFLIFMCWASYTAAYVGRYNYSASIVEIIRSLGTTKEAAGLVGSFFFFAYGLGQLIHGILSKKYNTKYSVFIALAGSAAINLTVPFCSEFSFVKYLWFINGILQSILWSSLVKTLSMYLNPELMPSAVTAMSTTVAVGTFFAYGSAALYSKLAVSWKISFFVAAAVLCVVGIMWFAGMNKIEKYDKIPSVSPVSSGKKSKITFKKLLPWLTVAVSAIANGFIKDGSTTWTPSVLTEEFGLNASLSIMITLLLPVLAIFGAQIVNVFHKKYKNTTAFNAAFYAVCTAAVLGIIFTFKIKSAVLTLSLFALVACMMSAVNNVITSIIPLYSKNKESSGTLAGVLNMFCYVGSTLSTALLGKIADNTGWNDVFLCIFFFSTIAAAANIFEYFLSGNKKKT